MFIKGIEIGNCYTLDTDQERRSKLNKETKNKRKETNKAPYNFDLIFDEKKKVPIHTSMTIGLERLFCVLNHVSSVHQLKIFSFS